MFQDNSFTAAFLTMGIVVIILTLRSIQFRYEIDKIKKQLIELQTKKPSGQKRNEHGKFIKSGDSQPA